MLNSTAEVGLWQDAAAQTLCSSAEILLANAPCCWPIVFFFLLSVRRFVPSNPLHFIHALELLNGTRNLRATS